MPASSFIALLPRLLRHPTLTRSLRSAATASPRDTAIKSNVPTRWERRALRASSSSSASSHAGGPGGDDEAGGEPSDRFIPQRGALDLADAHYELCKDENAGGDDDTKRKALEKGLLNKTDKEARVLSFRNKAPAPPEGHTNSLKVLYSQNKSQAREPTRSARAIPNQPSKILDAPDLLDDYYLNLVDWATTDKLAVALGPAVYLWDAKSGSIEELLCLEEEEDYVCSLKWIQQGTHLAVGTASANVQLWDATALKQVRCMGGQADRISSLSWNQHILSSGSKDSTIVHHDVRVQDHHVATLKGHEQEVCGLAWSPDGSTLASGGNDNRLCIWDAAQSLAGGRGHLSPRHVLTDHQAAVKALAWSPHERNLLASGGGTADRCIKFWNSQTGACLNSIDTGSQVCSLLWNPHEKEILSSHGFSKNELCLWRYPSMTRVKELTGHTARVLHLAASPSAGSMVVSAGADETLRFWNIFGEPKAKSGSSAASASSSLAKKMCIR